MATIKGLVRSYSAAAKRSEKAQQKKAREATKRYKQQLKEEEITNAVDAVNVYNDYIELIQSAHKNCTETIDWNKIKNTVAPEQPGEVRPNEVHAEKRLKSYRPSILDKIFRSTSKKVSQLEKLLEEAKKKDKRENDLIQKEYSEEIENWKLLQQIAKGIEEKAFESYKDAIEYFNPFSDIGELGTQIEFSISTNQVDLDLHINGTEIIPDYILKQLASGKLSKKKMTKSKFNELYQDHICSVVLRIARELFAYLPIKQTRINAIGQILNSSTGHLEEKPILSVIMIPETINALNMESIDPSDSMQNFVHNMKFAKTKGFSPVNKIELK